MHAFVFRSCSLYSNATWQRSAWFYLNSLPRKVPGKVSAPPDVECEIMWRQLLRKVNEDFVVRAATSLSAYDYDDYLTQRHADRSDSIRGPLQGGGLIEGRWLLSLSLGCPMGSPSHSVENTAFSLQESV